MTDLPIQIGPHSVTREIGRGGMGVVYLARDTKLDRDVAIKALPEAWAGQPERLARFRQEARVLAQLNHANVAGIHGLEEQDGQMFLVLEYVRGDTLADRIRAGAIPADEAVGIAIEIAAGVEAAHEAGVIHRDLKPENIKITPAGKVKVLDFGIAKVQAGEVSSTSATSLTLDNSTLPGAILGTAQYMSPEQARGRVVDKRTDIWSFGVVLFEMLTGTSPFARATVGDCIAAVLHDGIDLDHLPRDAPEGVRRVIRRCIERDPHRRLHDIADVRIELEDAWTAADRPGDPCEGGLLRGKPIVDRSFRITDAVCKQLDRAGLDPLVPGWDLQYADNQRESNTLIIWIPSFGADHASPSFRHLMESCQHRMITPTPIGMEPGTSLRPDLSLQNQLVLLRVLAVELRAAHQPDRLIIAGASCGGITALRCVAGDVAGGLFDGSIVIDPDLDEQDCFVTRLFADLDPAAQDDAVRAITKVSASCSTLDEWITMHAYLLQCIEKMQDDITPLIRQGQELVAPYRDVQHAGDSPFIPWLRDACTKTTAVRCVFPATARKQRLVGEMRMLHLDEACFGAGFDGEEMVFAQAPSSIDLHRTERMIESIDDFVDSL